MRHGWGFQGYGPRGMRGRFGAWGWFGMGMGPCGWFWGGPWWAEMDAEEELTLLRRQRDRLRDQLEWIEARIAKLEKEMSGERSAQ
ncbi:MAG: hypothetical protein Kow0047_16670 [Anaerolineae bacterium]